MRGGEGNETVECVKGSRSFFYFFYCVLVNVYRGVVSFYFSCDEFLSSVCVLG